MKFHPAKIFLAIFSILIGLTIGVLVALLQFLIVLIRFPMDVYRTASQAYDERHIRKAQQLTKEDVWQRHIKRMDEKYGRNEENSNL